MNAVSLLIPLLVSFVADHPTRQFVPGASGIERLPVTIADHDGLRLTAVVVEANGERQLQLELKNLSTTDVLLFDSKDGPARIWDTSGFVLEKRSSNEDWRRHALDEGCSKYLPDSPIELKQGQMWGSRSSLGNLEQSWVRARPPLESPEAHLRLDNVTGVVELHRVRIKVLAPRASSVRNWEKFGFFPRLADTEIPSVEVEVPLDRPLYVLPPEEGRVLRDRPIDACGDLRERRRW